MRGRHDVMRRRFDTVGGRYDLVRKAGKARLDQLVRREETIW